MRVPAPIFSLSTSAFGWTLTVGSSNIDASGTLYHRDRADSLAQPQAEQDHRAQDRPPPGDGRHLRISHGLGRIDLRDGHLRRAIPESDDLPVEVRLELVFVEPSLIEVYSLVIEKACAEGSKAVRGLGNPLSGCEGEKNRVHAGCQSPVERHAPGRSSLKKT